MEVPILLRRQEDGTWREHFPVIRIPWDFRHEDGESAESLTEWLEGFLSEDDTGEWYASYDKYGSDTQDNIESEVVVRPQVKG